MGEMLAIIKDYTSSKGAIKSKDLMELLGCRGADVREEVNRLRRIGEPICSCKNGYYYSHTDNDIIRTIGNLEGRVKSIQSAIDGLTVALIINK